LTKGGGPTFGLTAWVCDEHTDKLADDYFPIVGQMQRNPRYTNKRIMDPQLKCFVDEQGIEIPPEWGLPTPNPSAAYDSLAKYAKSIPWMSKDQLRDMNTAWQWTTQHFGVYMHHARVVSYQEAKTHFDLSSSSGAPFNVLYPTKRELFEKDPEMDAWLKQDWKRMAEDPNWTCLFTNSLKEELRTAEKMKANSIRTFLAGGVDAVAHGTRLFVDMNEKMYASHLKSASAVGMSPYKGNWDILYQKLKTFKKGYALDESQYDSSLRAYMMWGCAQLRWSMLREEDRTVENFKRFQIYYRNLVNTVIICPDGVLIMKKTGNPSGSVNTITDNTLILYTLMAYAWIRNAPEQDKTYTAFEMNTAKALVGDDNTWTVSDESHEYYNARTVIDEWKTLGVTTTTDSLEPRHPKELDFLSAHTVFLQGTAVPIYDRTKLMTSLLYAPEKHITPATTLERLSGLLSIGWVDVQFRHFCYDAIDWLLTKYDEVLFEDPRWIMAKCQLKRDDDYCRLFTSRGYLRPQSLSGARVKLIQPDKTLNMSVLPKRNGTKPGKKTIKTTTVRRSRRGARKGQVTSTVVVRNRPRKRQNRRRNGRNPAGGGGASGVGRTRNMPRSRKMCVVEEDEFIAAITVANQPNFNNVAYPINPGQSSTFPWLSKEAAQWEKYTFEYLEFYYKREVSEFATAGQTGKVIFSVDFDAADSPPSTKQQMEDTDPHCDAMPCENMRLVVPAKNLRGPGTLAKYVRIAGLPGASDIKTYDVGNLNVATQGIAANSEVGELHVRYRVRFEVPVLEPTTTAPANNQVAVFTQSAVAGGATTVPTNLPLATVVVNGILVVNTAGSFVLPTGNYLVDIEVSSANSAGIAATSLQINKNGAAFGPAMLSAVVTGGSGNTTSASTFIASNGSDAYTFQLTQTYAAGAQTNSAFVRFTAV
jgi:hypothetical protein